MLSALSLANLAGLGMGALVPFLIFAYMHQLRGRRRTVSSVLLLKKLAVRIKVKRKFKPPLRFFLELLALLLLVIAASYPLLRERASRCAVIIDTSLSMRTKDGESDTRFGKAIREGIKWVDEQSEQSTFSVFESAPKLHLVGNANDTKSKALSRLENIRPALTADSLEGSLAELAASGEFDSVAVFTDREADYLKDIDSVGAQKKNSLASLFGDSQDGQITKTVTKVEIRKVGSPVGNVYLSRVRTERPRPTDSGASASHPSIIATVAASDSRPREVIVSIVDDDKPGQAPLQSAKIKLDSKRPVDVRFQPGGDESQDRVFRIFLSPTEGENGLTEDDAVWIRQGGSGAERILFISGTNSSGEALGLGEMQGFEFDVLSSEKFSTQSSESISAYDILIFHHSAPRVAPERPTLLILPPTENGIFPVSSEIQTPRISSWKEEHPLTSYLQVPLLRFNAALTFATPLWSQSVISVEQGAVVVAGESRGIRFLGVGFEIFPFTGGTTPTISILTLNMLNWLSNTPGSGVSGSVGGNIRLEAGGWEVLAPESKVEKISVSGPEPRLYQMEKPGTYVALRTVNGVREKRTYTANITFPEESSTFTPGAIAVTRNTTHEEMMRQKETPLWPIFVMFAFVVILFEWLIGMLRRSVAE